MNILFEIFMNALLVAGILFLIVIIYAIVTTPFRKYRKRQATEKFLEILNNELSKLNEEVKKEENIKKETTKKARNTKKKEEK